MLSSQPSPLSRLPGPKGLPMLGNLLQIDLPRLHIILEEWADQYGDIYRFNLANKPVVVISNPESIQQILRERPQTFRRVESIERVSRELGTHGVFAAEGDQWQRQRTLVMQAFKPEQLRRFFPTLRLITERLYHRWTKTAESGTLIEVDKDWMLFTVDVTTQFAFGYDINLLQNQNADFQKHLESQLPGFNRRANAPFPYWHYFKLPSDRAMEKSLVVIKETIEGFIRQTRQRLEQQPGAQPCNFLEALLLAQDENGIPLSDEEIQGNVITILLGGEDTTAHTLSWLLYLICKHPDVQEKLQQEADAALGNQTLPSDFAILDKLPYLEAVAQETLRLKNVAPILYMEPNRDVELNGTAIPQGTVLMLLNRYSALQEEHFTDACRFKPERWLNGSSASCRHNRNAFLPFGAGPRFCPGRSLAMLEIKMAMAMVSRNFSLLYTDTGQPIREVFSFTMMPENLRIGFKKR